MDKKFIGISILNIVLYSLSFVIMILSSSFFIQIITVICSILISIILTRHILIKYKDVSLDNALHITDIAHSMRNPLAKISGNAQIIAMSNQSKQTDNIIKDVIELDKMITGLLDHSIIIENIQKKFNCCISELLEEECKTCKEIANGKSFEYEIEKNIEFLTNEINVKVLFSTLLENAMKYSVEEVKCIATNKEIIISNDTNLEDGNYDHLFERFKRQNNSKNGFGVGLSIAKTIVIHANRDITAYVKNSTMYIKITKQKG